MQHKNNSEGEWIKKSFLEQFANIGSEVYRASNWRAKENDDFAQKAFLRSLELFDLTKNSSLTYPQLRELCRINEMWIDFFQYENKYNSTREYFDKYFADITIAYSKSRKEFVQENA